MSIEGVISTLALVAIYAGFWVLYVVARRKAVRWLDER